MNMKLNLSLQISLRIRRSGTEYDIICIIAHLHVMHWSLVHNFQKFEPHRTNVKRHSNERDARKRRTQNMLCATQKNNVAARIIWIVHAQVDKIATTVSQGRQRTQRTK